MKHMQEAIASLVDEKEPMPEWAKDMAEEIAEIKLLLGLMVRQNSEKRKRNFIRKLRKRLKAEPNSRKYPIVRYAGKEYGVDAQGILFDISNQRTLSAKEAYEIFEFLFENKEELQKYIIGGVV
jgi:hypothetical protein